MAITAQDVKQLKELTNCGMMDCKRALEETNGDVDAAIKYLREKGLAKVAKKSGRIAAEGLVYAKVDEAKKVGVVVEINVETDFAAKTERFIEFVEMVAQAVIDNDVADVDALKEVVPAGESEKIGDILNERIATIGENIQIRRFTRMTGDLYTPLAMLVLGYYLAGAKMTPALARGGTYAVLVLRHAVIPALLIAVLALIPDVNPKVAVAAVIPAAAPVGASVTVFSARYGKDAAYPTALVAISTLLSVVTLPVVVSVAMHLFGNGNR